MSHGCTPYEGEALVCCDRPAPCKFRTSLEYRTACIARFLHALQRNHLLLLDADGHLFPQSSSIRGLLAGGDAGSRRPRQRRNSTGQSLRAAAFSRLRHCRARTFNPGLCSPLGRNPHPVARIPWRVSVTLVQAIEIRVQPPLAPVLWLRGAYSPRNAVQATVSRMPFFPWRSEPVFCFFFSYLHRDLGSEAV